MRHMLQPGLLLWFLPLLTAWIRIAHQKTEINSSCHYARLEISANSSTYTRFLSPAHSDTSPKPKKKYFVPPLCEDFLTGFPLKISQLTFLGILSREKFHPQVKKISIVFSENALSTNVIYKNPGAKNPFGSTIKSHPKSSLEGLSIAKPSNYSEGLLSEGFIQFTSKPLFYYSKENAFFFLLSMPVLIQRELIRKYLSLSMKLWIISPVHYSGRQIASVSLSYLYFQCVDELNPIITVGP